MVVSAKPLHHDPLLSRVSDMWFDNPMSMLFSKREDIIDWAFGPLGCYPHFLLWVSVYHSSTFF